MSVQSILTELQQTKKTYSYRTADFRLKVMLDEVKFNFLNNLKSDLFS